MAGSRLIAGCKKKHWTVSEVIEAQYLKNNSLQAPYFSNFCACAKARGIISIAGILPNPPLEQAFSENSVTSSTLHTGE